MFLTVTIVGFVKERRASWAQRFYDLAPLLLRPILGPDRDHQLFLCARSAPIGFLVGNICRSWLYAVIAFAAFAPLILIMDFIGIADAAVDPGDHRDAGSKLVAFIQAYILTCVYLIDALCIRNSPTPVEFSLQPNSNRKE
ncbi:MAG: hypothetical protein H6899_14765 [Rhodobacter sp.]|nr:hypothetical protein [Rhodobacter sp.]